MKSNKVIFELSIRSIIKNKHKYVVALLAVLLTALLFSTVASLGYMIWGSIRETQLQARGDKSMATLRFIMPEEYEELKNDSMIKSQSYSIIVAVMEQNDLIMEMRYGEAQFAKNMYSYPTTGNMPEKKSEIATSIQMLEALGGDAALGEEIELSIPIGNTVYTDTFIVSGFWDAGVLRTQHQCWVSKEFCDELVPQPTVSVYEQEQSSFAGYYMMDIDFYNSRNIEQKLLQVLQRHGYSPSEIICQPSSVYSEQESPKIMGAVVVALCVMLVIGYLLIYNIFHIRIMLDTQYYALLSVLGMEEKQLEVLVRTEAFFLSLIGAPIGIILGRIVAYWLVPAVAGFMAFEIVLDQTVAWWVYGVIFIFTGVTVYLSCRKPINTVKKLSLVSGMEYQGTIRRTKIRKSQNGLRICEMAWRNIFREKGKLWTVVLGVSLAIILFNSVYSLVGGFSLEKYLVNSIDSDYIVSDSSILNMELEKRLDGISQNMCRQLEETESVIECLYTYMNEGNIEINMPTKQTSKSDFYDSRIEETGGIISSQIYGLEEKDVKNVELIEGDLDIEKFLTGNYIIINTSLSGKFFYHVGDKVKVQFANGNEETYEVLGVGEVPYIIGARYWSDFGCRIILPLSEYKENMGTTGAMLARINCDKKSDFFQEDIIERIADDEGLVCVSRDDYIEEFADFKRAYLLIGGMLTAVIGVIGLLNFANTIITSVYYRERELTILNIVGMTERQCSNMLLCEGVYYALFSIVFTDTIGFLFSYGLVKIMSNILWFVEWNFSIDVLLAGNFLFLIISCVSTILTYYIIGKKNMVLRLQKFNV